VASQLAEALSIEVAPASGHATIVRIAILKVVGVLFFCVDRHEFALNARR
jgi:hypothetical protein